MMRFLQRRFPTLAALALAAASLGGCGGGNPLDNPPPVSNPPGASGQKLSFAYFQRCVNPILLAELAIVQNGVSSTNTCASSGCHNNVTGTGGALRVIPEAQALDVKDVTNTADVIRASDMYKNFYSAQGATTPGAPLSSRLLQKPLLLNVLHGGGLVFPAQTDPNAEVFAYWISHPAPSGQDEFSPATWVMFSNGDPDTGTCLTQ